MINKKLLNLIYVFGLLDLLSFIRNIDVFYHLKDKFELLFQNDIIGVLILIFPFFLIVSLPFSAYFSFKKPLTGIYIYFCQFPFRILSYITTFGFIFNVFFDLDRWLSYTLCIIAELVRLIVSIVYMKKQQALNYKDDNILD
jgi:hypothetical protein